MFFLWSVIKAKAQETCSEVRRSQQRKESLRAPSREEKLEEEGAKECLVLAMEIGASHAPRPKKPLQYSQNKGRLMNEAITGDRGQRHKAEEVKCCLMTRVEV